MLVTLDNYIFPELHANFNGTWRRAFLDEGLQSFFIEGYLCFCFLGGLGGDGGGGSNERLVPNRNGDNNGIKKLSAFLFILIPFLLLDLTRVM